MMAVGGGANRPKLTNRRGQPENQEEEERARKVRLRLLQQQPASLREVAHDLLRLGEDLALRVARGGNSAELVLDELHPIRALEGGQRRHAGLLRGPDRFDPGRDAAPQLLTAGSRKLNR